MAEPRAWTCLGKLQADKPSLFWMLSPPGRSPAPSRCSKDRKFCVMRPETRSPCIRETLTNSSPRLLFWAICPSTFTWWACNPATFSSGRGFVACCAEIVAACRRAGSENHRWLAGGIGRTDASLRRQKTRTLDRVLKGGGFQQRRKCSKISVLAAGDVAGVEKIFSAACEGASPCV